MVESKYWVWTAKETAQLRTETLADPAADQVLTRTRYTAVSPGTEMALYMMTHVGFPDPNNKYAKYPHRGGYLNVGIVEKAGKDVADRLKPGTWVFSCAGHTEYALLKPGDVWSAPFALPESLHAPEAALLGMVRIGYAAPYQAPPALRESVVVLGGGLVGNFAAQLYKASGADIVLVEKDDFRRNIAAQCGLETLSSLDDVARRFPGGPRIAVEATGVPQLSVEAMKMAAQGGRMVILSSPRGEAPVNFYNHIHAKLLRVIGAHAKCLVDGSAAQKMMVDLAADSTVKLKPCLTHVASWKQAPEVWNIYARNPVARLGTAFDWSK
jgi:threonine dehydrogenase-like Zn-dependent dehydrogenase